jgi:N-acetylglucosamine-6-phosphate deacetylase
LTQPTIYTASRIFTGEKWLTDHAIVTSDGMIEKVVPVSKLPSRSKKQHFASGFIAPAFIDAQIYGAQGKLFSVYPQTDTLEKLVEYCRKGGAACCVPTVATNNLAVFYKCIDAVKEYLDNKGTGVLGLHLEGPWINPEKKGAHLDTFIHSPTLKEAEKLLQYGRGIIKMITLAPEVCSREVIDLVVSHGIIVSAGHSNASFAEALDGFEHGISTVTHLFNAMSALHHREPGLAGAAMITEKIMASIVPDGYHVDFNVVRIAKKVMGDRLFAITDAVTETKEGPYQHYPAGDKYESAGILSGSALTMQKALFNLVNRAGISLEEALCMCSLYPARALKEDHRIGLLKKGYAASMIVLNQELQLETLI